MLRRLLYFTWGVLGLIGIVKMYLDSAIRIQYRIYRGLLPSYGLASFGWSVCCLLFFGSSIYVGTGVVLDTSRKQKTIKRLSIVALLYALMLLPFSEEFGTPTLIGAVTAIGFAVVTRMTFRTHRN
jgi:hypothetical protein